MADKRGKSTPVAPTGFTPAQSPPPAPMPLHVERPAHFPAAAAGTARRRSAPLSYDEVAQAAKAIDAAGEKVTIARIRQQVGGAAETVTAFLSQWREVRRTARAGGDALPESLRMALLHEFAAQREAAKAEMHEQCAKQREAASELDSELRGARDTIAAQQRTIEGLQNDLSQASQKVTAAEQAAELARAKLSAEVQALVDQQQSVQKKLAQTLQELGQTRCRAEVEAERVKTLASHNDRLRTELTQAARKAEDAAQKVAMAEQKAAVATTKLEGQAELLAIAREQNQQDRRRMEGLLSESKNSHDRAHAAEETQEYLRHKLDTAHAAKKTHAAHAGRDKKP